jgi:hypothetical protein
VVAVSDDDVITPLLNGRFNNNACCRSCSCFCCNDDVVSISRLGDNETGGSGDVVAVVLPNSARTADGCKLVVESCIPNSSSLLQL